MVHRDDLAKAIIRSFDGNGGTFNITDDEPVNQLNFFEWLMKEQIAHYHHSLLITTVHTKKGITNKRVSNKRFQRGAWFRIPTFREGLRMS